MIRRAVATLVALVALAPPAAAQEVALTEAPASGDCFRYHIELDLTGKLLLTLDGKAEALRLEAKARHVFRERTLTATEGLPAKSARHYEEAVSATVVDVEKTNRALPGDRALVVASRGSAGLLCFAPAGPLTRDELDLVTEHFNPQCVVGLLPGKAVKVGDTWAVPAPAAQAACLFDGLIKHTLKGTLTAVADGKATFTITGTADGIEHGAKVALVVSATGTYDVAAKRVTALTWKQTDDRAQGPVAPASKVDVLVTLKREALADAPKELADAALANLPRGDVPAELLLLKFADPKGRYSLTHGRDWHVTGQTDDHLILRLLDKGEFAAQATVATWKKAEPGKHATADEFKKAVTATPGWVASRVLDDGEVPTTDGRWVYRVAAEGKLDERAVVQTFHLVAGPRGDQAAITVAVPPEKLKAAGTRDKELVTGLTFPAQK